MQLPSLLKLTESVWRIGVDRLYQVVPQCLMLPSWLSFEMVWLVSRLSRLQPVVLRFRIPLLSAALQTALDFVIPVCVLVIAVRLHQLQPPAQSSARLCCNAWRRLGGNLV